MEMAAPLPVTTLTRPPVPACSNAAASAKAIPGVSSAGFSTTEHPAASAGATLREGNSAGKFHGENAATGPIYAYYLNIIYLPAQANLPFLLQRL